MYSSQLVNHFNTPEIIKKAQTVTSVRSLAKPIRHFGINPEIAVDSDYNNGSTLIFRFISLAKFNDGLESLPFSVQQNQLVTALKLSFSGGVTLQCKEKSAVYPVIQFTFERNGLEVRESACDTLIQGYIMNNCWYKEVRTLDGDSNTHPHYFCKDVNYIIIGFKTTDVKYNQALLDSWKDWTGARYIYINFPEQLNLIKMTLYHKQMSDDASANLFSYIVIVKCEGVDTKEKEMILLDFVQRFRAQKTSNFISVYEEVLQ